MPSLNIFRFEHQREGGLNHRSKRSIMFTVPAPLKWCGSLRYRLRMQQLCTAHKAAIVSLPNIGRSRIGRLRRLVLWRIITFGDWPLGRSYWKMVVVPNEALTHKKENYFTRIIPYFNVPLKGIFRDYQKTTVFCSKLFHYVIVIKSTMIFFLAIRMY
jgi:hypothetical protein